MSTVKVAHRATVKAVDDPEKRGRIQVASATLMGVDENGEAIDFPGWLEPTFPVLFSLDGDQVTSGWFAIPSPGTLVEIEVAQTSTYDETPGQTAISDPDPRWRVCYLRSGDTLPPEFKKNYPKRMGLKTASGHLLMFDDTTRPGEGVVSLTHRDGAGIILDADGSATIKDKSAVGVTVKLSKGKITIGRPGIELLSLFNQLLTALDAYATAENAAAVGPLAGLAPGATALKASVTLVKQALGQIKG